MADSIALARDSVGARLRAELAEQQAIRAAEKTRIPSAATAFRDSARFWFLPASPDFHEVGRARYPNGSDELAWLHPLVLLRPWRRWPMRTTASVAGQDDDEFSTVYDGIDVSPYEHIIEPDGESDLLSLPDMMAEEQGILPAGIAQQFGGHGLLSSQLLADTGIVGVPRTTLLHDRGTTYYSYTRGRFHNRFRNGRELDLGLGYRLSTDPSTFLRYNQYQYAGMIVQPVGQSWELRAAGTLNDLEAPIFSQPELRGAIVRRELQQRQLRARLAHNDQRESSLGSRGITLDYSRQHSDADGAITNRFDEWKYRFGYEQIHWGGSWGTIFSGGIQSDEYRAGVGICQRSSYDLRGQLVSRSKVSVFGITGSLVWPDNRQLIPSVSIAYGVPGTRSSWWFGLAYESRAPLLSELFLPLRAAGVVPKVQTYTESGNADLQSERSLAASVTYKFQGEKFQGSLVSLAGYRDHAIIWDADITENEAHYMPVNEYRRFAAVGGTGTYEAIAGGTLFGSVGGWMTSGGKTQDSPAFQWTLGADMLLPWRSKNISLHGSTELRYVDSYTGPYGDILEGKVESHSTLSIVMKSFEFHWVITNGLNADTRFRDFTPQPDRLDRIGFVWHFAD